LSGDFIMALIGLLDDNSFFPFMWEEKDKLSFIKVLFKTCLETYEIEII
jgi:hypothetical protein